MNCAKGKECYWLFCFRYVRFIRVAKSDGMTYFCASIRAEMKKSVSYKVDVSIDKVQVVQEAQCECGAGQGPTAHCKHVACLLYAVHCITHTSKNALSVYDTI